MSSRHTCSPGMHSLDAEDEHCAIGSAIRHRELEGRRPESSGEEIHVGDVILAKVELRHFWHD